MRLWRPLSAAALIAVACTGAQSAPEWGLKATGLAGAPVADGEGHSARVTVEPTLKWKLPSVEIRGGVRLRWLDLQRERRTDVDVRELTAAWRGKQTTVTLGAQQLNWGRMDILRVTDVVNPVDLHDLFYEDLPQAKLALWMANWEWQNGGQTVQVVATPQVPVDRLPQRVAGLPVRVAKPADSVAHSTLALRYGFEAAGWNADLVAIRGWQSAPLLRPVIGATGVSLQGSLARQNSIGFSADKPLGGTVLRLEGLYARTTPEDAGLGLPAQRSLSLGAGLDLRSGPWFFATQVIAQHNPDAIAGAPEHGAFVSAIVQRKWLQDRLSGRALHICETDSGSSWSSLQASYELSAHQLLQIQGDWFQGEPSAAFGGFRGRSRIAASMRFQF
jgi:hypothetical protein